MRFYFIFFAHIRARERSDCFYTSSWSEWSDCSWLCGPNGTRERTRKKNCSGKVSQQGESTPCNNVCFNGGRFKNGECKCSSGTAGICCERFVNPGDDDNRCSKWFSPPKNGKLKCSRDPTSSWDWDCRPKCTNGFSALLPLPERVSCTSEKLEMIPRRSSLVGQMCTESKPATALEFSADLIYVRKGIKISF